MPAVSATRGGGAGSPGPQFDLEADAFPPLPGLEASPTVNQIVKGASGGPIGATVTTGLPPSAAAIISSSASVQASTPATSTALASANLVPSVTDPPLSTAAPSTTTSATASEHTASPQWTENR